MSGKCQCECYGHFGEDDEVIVKHPYGEEVEEVVRFTCEVRGIRETFMLCKTCTSECHSELCKR